MPAVIESTLYVTPGGAVVPGSTQQNSRDDLRPGYQVLLHSVHVATTYSWDLSFASNSPGSTVPGTPFDGTVSASALLPPLGSTSRDAKFNVDFEGSYLIRLVVDAGLPTEDTQFIRCRLLTLFGELKLVAAGERRDEKGVIPVDATPEGWSNDQNANLQRISLLLRRLSTSGRVLYVDANRGRDNGADQNDYENLISLPGPDGARPEETGIKVRAVAHGDFASINEAIAYAVAAPSRGEPAPSDTNPYLIKIQPGLYEEDLNLAAYVHIMGDSGQTVTIRTVNAGGTGTHTFNPMVPANQARLILSGLTFINTANTTSPLLYLQGGEVMILNCFFYQKGDGVAQGPALACITTDPALAPKVGLLFPSISTLATDDHTCAVFFDAPDSHLDCFDAQIEAITNGLIVNPSLYENCDVSITNNTGVRATYPFVGYPSSLNVLNSSFATTDGDHAITLDTFGGNKPGKVDVLLDHVFLYGKIEFDTSKALGGASIDQSSVSHMPAQNGGGGGGGPPEFLRLPAAPGQLPNMATILRSDTLWYVKGYTDPRQGPGGTPTIPAANQVNVEDVQRILDTLWLAVFPTAGSPFQSLTGAYNGYSSLDPLVAGVGLGRNINAVGGAVQIQGASWPTALESSRKNGGLQVEGIIDIGGFISGAGADTVAKVGGSEIHLNPNQAGAGPFIGLGRATWPNGVTQKDRGFAAGLIVAGGAQIEGETSAYHLHLRTADLNNPNTGKTGNIYMVAGATQGANEGGEVHLVGGSQHTPGGTVGNVWLVPGTTETPTAGKVWFTGKMTGGNRASLAPSGNFVPGTAGTLFFGTPTGVVSFTLTGMEATAIVAATSINTQVRGITAAEVAGKVVLYSEYGPGGDILFLGGDAALNTAMGNYSLGSGATFTPGVYGHKVAVDVPQNGRLRVNGDLEYTGSLIPNPGGGGVYANTALPVYNLALGSNIDILGVSLQAGVNTSVVLNAAEPTGRRITITDELGMATIVPPAAGQRIIISDSGGGTPFDGGAATLEITVADGAVSLYKTLAGKWKSY